MFVVPKNGYKIPDPSLSDFLPEQGREVEKNTYWVRRLREAALKDEEGKALDGAMATIRSFA